MSLFSPFYSLVLSSSSQRATGSWSGEKAGWSCPWSKWLVPASRLHIFAWPEARPAGSIMASRSWRQGGGRTQERAACTMSKAGPPDMSVDVEPNIAPKSTKSEEKKPLVAPADTSSDVAESPAKKAVAPAPTGPPLYFGCCCGYVEKNETPIDGCGCEEQCCIAEFRFHCCNSTQWRDVSWYDGCHPNAFCATRDDRCARAAR
jgi:hypothetical protein